MVPLSKEEAEKTQKIRGQLRGYKRRPSVMILMTLSGKSLSVKEIVTPDAAAARKSRSCASVGSGFR
jgi:hypothetical protein